MNSGQEMQLAESRAKVMKALGHPSRMYIATILASNEASVGELTEAVGSDVSTVSKHLSMMKQAGLLTDRKEANRVLYSLVCPCIMEFIHCIDDVIQKDVAKRLDCLVPAGRSGTNHQSPAVDGIGTLRRDS
jgi:ArsR family transcriptional regulator